MSANPKTGREGSATDGYQISRRKQLILKAIIDAHIAYGEPVGSKYLAQDKQLSCSSATIRNEMAELEALGFLEQPHTSAGRVPSQLGYRFYVDSLLSNYRRTTEEISEITRSLGRKISELNQILAEASRLASSMTNYTALSVRPPASRVRAERFEGIFLDARSFLLVLMLGGGAVKTKTIRLSFAVDPGIVAMLIASLNEHLVECEADQISLPVILEIERRMGEFGAMVHPIVRAVYDMMTEDDAGDLQIEGVNRLLQYPEYSDREELRSVIDLLEKKGPILDMVNASRDSDAVNVYIGSENNVKVMNNSTLVFKTIRSGGRVLGAIGVIGPRRMDYARVISTIDQLASGIDHLLSDEDDSKKSN